MASIEWLRLWHDMPNDPKWRTVARASGQPISLVIAVAVHLMVDASRNVTRGHVSVTAEDVASALDVTEDAVKAVFTAMQGRVLDGEKLSGWEKRQPKREDSGNPETGSKSATTRKREQRQRERDAKDQEGVTQGHAGSRNVTLDKETDKETDDAVGVRAAAEKPAAASTKSAAEPDHLSNPTEFCTAVLDAYESSWGSRPPMLMATMQRILALIAQHPRAAVAGWWASYFAFARTDEFLSGEKRPGFVADLNYLLKPDVFGRVIEASQRQAVAHG